jgi:hypothetical protein
MKHVTFDNDGKATHVYEVDEFGAEHRSGFIWFKAAVDRARLERRVKELEEVFKQMNTIELDKILGTMPGFLGVLPFNHLVKPVHLKRNYYFLIVNTDPCFRSGQHWIAIFLYNTWSGGVWTWRADYFDSLGNPPKQKSMLDFLQSWCGENWTFNSTALQSKNSSVCGCYCVYFILKRLHNYPMKEIVSRLLSFPSERRDTVVYEFCKSINYRKV